MNVIICIKLTLYCLEGGGETEMLKMEKVNPLGIMNVLGKVHD